MRSARVIISLILLVGSVFPVMADDINPPTLWDRGEDGSTYQRWEFDTDVFHPVADELNNPYGNPAITVLPMGSWEESWGGRTGVWPLSGMIIVDIPNNPVENAFKWVQIQLTWAAEEGHAQSHPCVSVTATDVNDQPVSDNITLESTIDVVLEQTNVEQAGEFWHHTTYLFKIIPNPKSETVSIGSAVMVDELVIDTICLPEPATMCLVALGGLGLLCRKRK